jgi:hypothetical protein
MLAGGYSGLDCSAIGSVLHELLARAAGSRQCWRTLPAQELTMMRSAGQSGRGVPKVAGPACPTKQQGDATSVASPRLRLGSVDADLTILKEADRRQLLAIWEARWHDPPPIVLLAPKLRRLIAYRLQLAHEPELVAGSSTFNSAALTQAPVVYRRTWRGVEHEVLRTGDGFRHRGQDYRSLSAIAREITGTRWNGLVFFSASHLSIPKRRQAPR